MNVTHQARLDSRRLGMLFFFIGSKNSRQVKHTQSKIKLGTLKQV